MKTLRYFSTFTGIGGIELGIHHALHTTHRSEIRRGKADPKKKSPGRKGLDAVQGEDPQAPNGRHPLNAQDRPYEGSLCVGYSEIDTYACEVLRHHFPDTKNYGDITKIQPKDLPDFDLFCGGFPCQAFSIAGKRRGFDDTRGTLFFEVARILDAKRPRLLLLENVKGLLSHDGGRTFEIIISTLAELGYDVQWQVINSKNHGVPQNRERVYIVGHLAGTRRPQVFPLTESNPAHLTEITSGVSDAQRIYDPAGIAKTLKGLGGGGGAKTGLYKTKTGIRRLTPTECERAQGFPDGWTAGYSDTQRYKMLGNAVTVFTISDIIKAICNTNE